MTAINVGNGSPFSFADTGDELVVSGILSNTGFTGTATVSALQAGNTVTNHGLITASGGDAAISLALGGTIGNSGLIAGVIESGGLLNFSNTGNFVGYLADTAVASPLANSIVNHGTMTFSGYVLTAPLAVGHAVIFLGSGDDQVVNSGSILGDVVLGDGNNTFDGRGGSVLGTVYGGTGDDTYYLTQATTILDSGGIDTVNARMAYTLGAGLEDLTLSGFGNFSGTGNAAANTITGNGSNNVLDGAGGDDTLLGGSGHDSMLGSTGNDSLDGQNGNDIVNGGFGNDTLLGSDGEDKLIGDVGTDQLFGGKGADTLDGGIGSDSLDGGAGNDVLIGGAFGTDHLTGGAGADLFVFLTANDSLAIKAADVITDFEVGIDHIDLSAVAPGGLAFIGTHAFTAGTPSLRETTNSVDTTTIQIDLDGNGKADMQIYLTGLHTLTASDFIF